MSQGGSRNAKSGSVLGGQTPNARIPSTSPPSRLSTPGSRLSTPGSMGSPPRTPGHGGIKRQGTKAKLPKKNGGSFAPFFCEGFPEPEAGAWPVRWTLSRPDVTREAERLLGNELPDKEGDDLTDVQRRWTDAYTAAMALVRAKRTWRRNIRREKRAVLLEWAMVRSKATDEAIARQVQKAAVDKGVDLPGLKLRVVPPEVFHMNKKVSGQVKRLALQENRIEYLPPEIFSRFTEVTMLRLSENRIPAIPQTVFNMTNLQMLLINDNDLCILPPELGDLVSLHTLHVQGNPRITRLPYEMGKLHHKSMGGLIQEYKYDKERVTYPPLETVEQGLNLACDLMRRVWDSASSGRLLLSGMSLVSVPPYICDMPLVTRLTELNIFQNEIKRLPAALGLLSRLELLRIDENSVVFPNQHLMQQSEPLRDATTRMITSAASAPFMGFLRRIADCRLTRSMVLQGGAWRYGGAKLELQLTVVSKEILDQANCKLLDLRHNELKDIPEGIARLPLLTALHVDHNRIRHMPDTLTALVWLRALTSSHNDLFNLPEVFAGMTSLVSLDFAHNGIQRVPESLALCTSLTRLDFSHNKIARLPDGLSCLVALRYLYVGYNPLVELPAGIGASQWLVEVSADCCMQLAHMTPPEVLNASVSQRCPLADPQFGESHLLCNAHRIVAMLAQPDVTQHLREGVPIKTLMQHVRVDAPGNPVVVLAGGAEASGLSSAVSELVKMATKPHIQLTPDAPLEAAAKAARLHIEYEPADTTFTRKWRLTKDATIRSLDAVMINQVVSAAMPHLCRSPPLVRYLWALWAGQEVGIADLSGTGIMSVRQDVLRLSWLTKLLLAYNRLSALPQLVTTLTQLITIDVSHNILTHIPDFFGDLTTLREIDLSYNMIVSLPKEMAQLANWTYPRNPKAMHLYSVEWAQGNPLTFPHNQILQLGPSQTRGFLRQVAAAVETGYLDFQHRELPLFPDQLTDFGFLINIDLGYNKIDRIPPAITNMVQLKSFCLAGNTVDRLPSRLSSLTSLEILDIRDNQMVGLPESIGLLHGQLKKLLLGRNRIGSLPGTLGMLSNLVHLHLNWNQLTSVPDEIGYCTSLEELQLSYNKLRMIPQTFSNLTNLKIATLQNNLLELLPTCLGNMPNLHRLAYQNNMWLMPQQEVLSWSEEHNMSSKLKLSNGMKVWCRFQKMQRWRPAHVDQVNEDGTFELSYIYDRDGGQGGLGMEKLDRESNVERYEKVEGADGTYHDAELVKPLSDHERLVDFLTRLHSCGKNKELDVSGFHMTEFLDYEAGSGFKHINDAGWYTRGLRKLNLSYNRISTLPLSVSRLSTLTAMDLSHNVIIGLPETLSALVCLNNIDLSFNRLTVLPCGLGLAAELETIIAHHNPLIAPPMEIMRQGAQKITTYLRGVHVARKNGKLDWNRLNLCTIDSLIVMLPEGDASLIQELYLDDNQIVVLNPGVLCELQNLEVFRACNNYLTVLHPNLGSFCPKLEQVTVDGNRLSHLPATLGTLSHLLSVSCDDNPHLMSPPPEINLMPSAAKIRYLQELHKGESDMRSSDFSNFDLHEFPEALMDMWTVSKMNLSHNNLTHLHPGVCKWNAITFLNLSHNQLVTIDSNLGLCCTLTALDVSHNCLRRIPIELGNISVLTSLVILPQRCPPSLDINGRTQGFDWCTHELTMRHVHNIQDCKIYPPEPVEESLACPVCLRSGNLGVTLFAADKCRQLLDDYLALEKQRQEMGMPSKQHPTRTCPTCGTATEIQHLLEAPLMRSSSIRMWLPSKIVHMRTWVPELPASTFRNAYTRRCAGRAPSDARHQADTIDSPPISLLEHVDGMRLAVKYLSRCLLGRQRGVIDVCAFQIPQFPLEVLDMGCVTVLKASNNCIKELPDDMDRLTCLQVLHLDHNLLETLPPGVRFWTALKDLQLNDNLLHDICPELGACVNLEKLNLHENRLVTLPHTIGNCSLLTQLTIQKNFLIVVPPSLSLCQVNMQHLDLDREAATNAFVSPPNPIPSQSGFQFMRYLGELFTYSREKRLFTPGYHLDYIPDLILESSTSVTALSLDENNISVLPEEIGNFTLLTELFSVCDNAITVIPACVGNMTMLISLRLSGNSLVALPDELSSMVSLKTFLVDHNSLTHFNRCFSTMTCLCMLSFADNKIRQVHPEFGLISSIHTLNFQDNPIVLPGPEIVDRPTPQVIDYLGRIKVSQFTGYLDLGDLNLTSLIHQLPDAYGSRAINLARNYITSLPPDFGKFVKCQELVLDANPMPFLDENIGKLKMLQLLSVERMREPLRAFPDNTFGELRALVVIRAAHNRITSLPDVFQFLAQIEFVDMSGNLLSVLPPSFMYCKRLRVLLLSNNQLHDLVKGFSQFHELHTVDVKNNSLTRLSRGMGSLVQRVPQKLKNHDLSGNPWMMPPPEIQVQGERKMLMYVGELWRAKLANGISMIDYKISEIYQEIIQENLVELTLDKNMIVVIPPGIGRLKKLEEFSIKKNRITRLPEELFELKKLSVLKLDDNKIAEIPRTIIKLRALTWLSIERNPICFFPGELANLESLEIINASPLGLDADLKNAFNAGFETFIAYMKTWATVASTGRLMLNWNANSAWDPLMAMPVQSWRFKDTLTNIYLNDNTIRVLPQNIAILHALKELHLQRNGLHCLPYAMCLLTGLQVLNLTDNSEMHDPPYEIVLDMKLRGIMKYLHAMHVAPTLKSLILNDFQLYYLKPNDLIQTTVEELSIQRKKAAFTRSDGQARNVGEVKRIDRRLALFDIEALSLDSNIYDSLPDALFLFTRLSFLSVAYNKLELVNEGISALSALTALHLEANQLASLPEQLASNRHLKKLTLNSNRFAGFPEVVRLLTALQVLNLANNVLEEVPAWLPSSNIQLKMLALQHNTIHALPADWGRLRKLVMLDLSNNHIIYLPPSIAHCRRLKALILSDNPLPSFPKDVLRIFGLQQLRFANTLMTGLPPELALLTNLKELALSGCSRLIWPPPEVVEAGLTRIMEYVGEHLEILEIDTETLEDIDTYQKELEREQNAENAREEVVRLKRELAGTDAVLKQTRQARRERHGEPEAREQELEAEVQRLTLQLVQANAKAEEFEEEPEEPFDPFEGMEVGSKITVESVAQHSVRVQELVSEIQEYQEELEQLEKEMVKHKRIGNKGKIEELQRRIEFINKQRRTIAGRIVEINNLRMLEEDLLVVDLELDLMDMPPDQAVNDTELDDEAEQSVIP